MKNPHDRVGNEIIKGDLVSIEGSCIGIVHEIKTGGLISGNQILPAKLVIRCEVILEVPPQAMLPNIVVVKRPVKNETPQVMA